MIGRLPPRAWILAALLAAAPAAAQEPAEEETPAQGEAAAAAPDEAEPEQPKRDESLRALLERLRATTAAERAEDEAREAEFRRRKEEQEALTLRTEAEARHLEAVSQELEARYGDNDLLIVELDERLTERIGQMGELFGVVRLVATDLSGHVYTSLTSLGMEERTEVLDKLGRNTGLPSTEDMEQLWFEVLRDMTAQGQVVAATVPVIVEQPEAEEGQAEPPPPVTEERSVARAGPFTAVSRGEYVQWVPAHQTVAVLERQPPPRYVGTIEGFQNGGPGFRRLAVDPSQGALLEALTGTPSLVERVRQGGGVGYAIVVLGLFALGLGLLRMVALTLTAQRVAEQERRSAPSRDNPLGRLLGAYEAHREKDPETLELKLDEALLRESSGVNRYLWVVQTISIIAPLLGLLGTVTGMIQTFQAITLFGAGDPKIMAGGISEALVTTTLGLVAAIPLVLLHALLASRARAVIGSLEEHRSSLIAERLAKMEVPA